MRIEPQPGQLNPNSAFVGHSGITPPGVCGSAAAMAQHAHTAAAPTASGSSFVETCFTPQTVTLWKSGVKKSEQLLERAGDRYQAHQRRHANQRHDDSDHADVLIALAVIKPADDQ